MKERFAVISFEKLQPLFVTKKVVRFGIYCFLLVEDGEVDVCINGMRRTVSPGMLACSIPSDRWEVWGAENVKGRFICFEAPFILAGLKGGYTLEPISFLNSDCHYPFFRLSEKRYGRLRLLTDDMAECVEEKPIFYDLLRAQLWQFIFLAEKEYVIDGNQGRKEENPNFIGRFINLVNNNFTRHHDSGFYAGQLNITPNYLNKIVKKAMGCNVREFILNRLMSEASILLRLTDITTNELAYKLGFEDPNYFIRCYKRIEGMTPREYQKKGTL